MSNDKPPAPTPLDLVAAIPLGDTSPVSEGLYAMPMPKTIEGWVAQGFTFRQPSKEK